MLLVSSCSPHAQFIETRFLVEIEYIVGATPTAYNQTTSSEWSIILSPTKDVFYIRGLRLLGPPTLWKKGILVSINT